MRQSLSPLARVFGLALLALTLVACGGEEAPSPSPTIEPPPAEDPAPEPAAEVAEPEGDDEAEAAGPRAETGFYVASLEGEEGYAAGDEGRFAVRFTGAGEYHLNSEFPTRITIEAPDALTLPKAELRGGDAAEFTEEAARFDVPFTAAEAGEHQVRAKVEFAVCNPQTCIPQTATLALALPVQ